MFPTTTTSTGYENEDDPSYCHKRVEIKSNIEDMLLDHESSIDWDSINSLFQQLTTLPSSPTPRYSSTEDDPMGRLLLGSLLSRNPPARILQAALEVFPESLYRNPAAYFTACCYGTPELVAQMLQHTLNVRHNKNKNNSDEDNECPFPWILSSHVSVDGAKALLEVYPQGVLQKSPYLSSHSPLDYFLTSTEMIEKRKIDVTMWNKFKLMLVAAEYSENSSSLPSCGLSPAHTLLKRILSCSDFWADPKRAQHCLWLLQQLRWTDQWVFEKVDQDGNYPLHVVLRRPCTKDSSGLVAARELIKILLKAHALSAQHQDTNGRLALHMAIENGWPCHDLLLSVFPEALDIRDPKTELYPFQAAATAHQPSTPVSSSTMLSSLDVTFELLRANPVHTTARFQVKLGRGVEAQA